MCHPRKESDNHAKGLATSSADSGEILARFWNVVGCERRERTEAYPYILSFLHIPRLFCWYAPYLPIFVRLFYS